MSDFELSVKSDVPLLRAMEAADALEKAVGEVLNGKRKPGDLPTEPMAVLVQFVRNTAKRGLQDEATA